MEEEKQRVLEYLGRKTDLVREPAKAHRAAWIRDDRADLAKEQMPAPEGPGEESEDRAGPMLPLPEAGSRLFGDTDGRAFWSQKARRSL
ncbi:MAG: hypothetical protein ACLU8D_13300 [Enterocloster sp.]